MEAFGLGLLEVPAWLTWELIFRILDSKMFSAIYWGAAAIVAVIGFVARMKYRDRNLKKLLDAYVEKATKGEGKERKSVKVVIGNAIAKARGRTSRGTPAAQFRADDVFENAARFFAQSQADVAIELLNREAEACEATIEYAQHQVRTARERAATAYLEIGSILREKGQGSKALDAFMSMLRVNPGDLDALRMLGSQCRDLQQYDASERWFTTLLYNLQQDPAALADIKRELSLVYLGSGDSTRAETVLDEAMAIERGRSSQRGEALTHELIGLLCTKRGRWKLARRAYGASRSIFVALNDSESVKRIDTRSIAMEAARDAELVRRRHNRRAGKSTPRVAESERPTVH